MNIRDFAIVYKAFLHQAIPFEQVIKTQTGYDLLFEPNDITTGVRLDFTAHTIRFF